MSEYGSFKPNTEQELRETLGKRLYEERTSRNLTISGLSRDSQMSVQTIRRIERGYPGHPYYSPKQLFLPSVWALMNICNALKVEISDLLFDKNRGTVFK